MTRRFRNRYARRLEALKLERSSWFAHWQEVSEYVDPYGAKYLASDRNDGRKKSQKIINSTATLALRNLRSGIMGGLTNPAQPWFKLALSPKNAMRRKKVKVWLEECSDYINAIFARSNVYRALHVAYGHLGAYGVAAILVEGDDKVGVRLTVLPPGQFCLASNAAGQVDVCYREFSMTVRQLAEEFGIDALRESTRKLYEDGKLDQWIEVIHVIEPRGDRNPESKDAKDMPFASVHVEKGAQEDEYLRVSGYNEFPVLCPRWDCSGEDVYGHSPAMMALGDIKALQQMELRKAEALAKIVNPPMLAVGDITSPKLSLQPGAVNRVPSSAGEAGFKPVYELRIDLSALSAEIEKHEQRIKRTFFEDLFLIISQLDNVRTATDIVERKAEKLLMVGPVVQSLEHEFLNPLIKRTYNLSKDRSDFPTLPDEVIDSQTLEIEYESQLASSQKSQSVGHIETFFQLAGPIVGQSPETAVRVNFEELIKEAAMKTGVAATVIRDDEEVQQLKEQMQQAQQQQAQAEQLMQGAQGAKLLADTQISPDNALGAMLGQTGLVG